MHDVNLRMLGMVVLLFAIPTPSLGLGVRSAPTLLFETEGLADGVDSGDIFTTLGGTALFWLDELEDQGTPKDRFDDAVRIKLWRTDGTAPGTFPLLPPDKSFFGNHPPVQGLLYFLVCPAEAPIEIFTSSVYLCDAPFDLELWRTDGTREGTFQLTKDEGPKIYWSQLSSWWPLPERGLVFYLASTKAGDLELWRTDGSRGGTRRVRNFRDLRIDAGVGLVAFEDHVYFITKRLGDDSNWIVRSDGTAEGTDLFLAPLAGKVQVASFVPTAHELFFLAEPRKEEDFEPGEDYGRTTLWVLGEGGESFRRVGTLGPSNPRKTDLGIASAGATLFFTIYGSDREVWSTDGSSEPVKITERMPDYSEGGLVWTEPYGLSNGQVLIRAFDHEFGSEPWVSDGTVEGTRRMGDLCPGWCSSFPAGLGNFDGAYLLAADDGENGSELWRWMPSTEGVGAVELVADLCPGSCSSWPNIIARAGERLFLEASDEAGRRRLWTLHPYSGLQRLQEPPDRYIGGYEFIFNRRVSQAQVVGGRLVFWATGENGFPELWALEVPPDPPASPPGPPLTSEELPGFEVRARITSGSGAWTPGRAEPDCLPETLCVSGAVEGRSEVFVRVVGPKPNGKLWPTLVKFTTSTVEVWIKQISSGLTKYYRLEGAAPGSGDLPGLFDRDGFEP